MKEKLTKKRNSKIFNFLFKYFPIKKNKIVLTNLPENTQEFNPVYISEEIFNRKLPWEVVFLGNCKDCEKYKNLNPHFRFVNKYSPSAIIEIMTGAVFIDGKNYFKMLLYRFANSGYIKSMLAVLSIISGEDTLNPLTKRASENIPVTKEDLLDYYKFCSCTPRESFRKFTKDALFNKPQTYNVDLHENSDLKHIKEELCKKYNIPSTSNIVLYFPAHRKNRRPNDYFLNFQHIKQAFETKTGKNCRIFTAYYTNNAKKQKIPFLQTASVIDISQSEDIASFLKISDYVISDYTKRIYDFIQMQKPCFLYISDHNDFNAEAELNCKFDDLPFPIAFDQAQLCSNIKNFDPSLYLKKLSNFEGAMPVINDKYNAKYVVNYLEKFYKYNLNYNYFINMHYSYFQQYLTGGLYKKLINFLYFFAANIFRFLPVNKRKIVFSAYKGRYYSCNPKYITEEILKQKLPVEIIWLAGRVTPEIKAQYPEGVKVVQYSSIQSLYEHATAKIWIDNVRKHILVNCKLKKKNNQCYIQTWHGSLGIKKIEGDAKILENYPLAVAANAEDTAMTDYLISNSDFEEDVYKKSFLIDENKIIRLGHPRCDLFFNNQERLKEKVFENLKIPKNKKLLLYAPTYRDSRSLSAYTINYPHLLSVLGENDWVLALRFHPNMMNAFPKNMDDFSNIINATFYPDIQELLCVSDILISDYSSCMFDYMLSRKPCFIYASDLQEYNQVRGFYYPLASTPFPIATSNVQLIENIKNFNLEEYKKAVDIFLKNKGSIDDGNSAKRMVEFIKDIFHGAK